MLFQRGNWNLLKRSDIKFEDGKGSSFCTRDFSVFTTSVNVASDSSGSNSKRFQYSSGDSDRSGECRK